MSTRRADPPGLQVSHRDAARDPRPGDRWRSCLGHEYLVVSVDERRTVLLDLLDGSKPWWRETYDFFRRHTAQGWLVDSVDNAHLKAA